MYCPRCNAYNAKEADFCEECGMTLKSAPIEGFEEQSYQGGSMQTPQFTSAAYGQSPYAMPYMSPGGFYGQSPPNPGNPSRNWAAIVGLIIGIISMPSCFFGFGIATGVTNIDEAMAIASAMSLLVAISGIIISCLGLKSTKRGIAIAGLICSIASTVFLGIIFSVAVMVLITSI